MLDLLNGATSFELKLAVPDHGRAVLRRLGFDPVEGEPRQIYFFDTPKLDLNRAGLFVRARRMPLGKGDTVVKLRPVDPPLLDPRLRRDPNFKIELDVMPGSFVCSASFKGRCSASDVFDVTEGRQPLAALFSRGQRDFYTAHAPDGLRMKHLVALGPTFVIRQKEQPKGFDRRIVLEFWLYPDGSRVLEISTKGEPEEAAELAQSFRDFVVESGLPLETKATTKTKSALQYFAKQIR